MEHSDRNVPIQLAESDSTYLVEDGIVAGNVTDKYQATNPIHRWLMNGFLSQVERYVHQAGCETVYEAGCGEGLLSLHLADKFPGCRFRGSDFSEQVVGIANGNAAKRHPEIRFDVASIYDLRPPQHSAELVICCEVLEHLDRPEEALQVIAGLATRRMIVSVPNEPLWRVLNFARGKYLRAWGNTPGHVNHWSPSAFRKFLERHVTVEQFSNPLPWSMALCRPRR